MAHRGASGDRPEHTLPAYELAARMGADYLSVDVTVTRDGHLVARHECELSATTDIAGRPQYLGLRTIHRVEGYLVRGWFVEAGQGLDPVGRLVDLLRADGVDRPDAPVVVVSDDLATLERVRRLGSRVPIHLRVLVGEHTAVLRDLGAAARVVSGLQPDKQLVRPRRLDGSLGEPTALVRTAAAGGAGAGGPHRPPSRSRQAPGLRRRRPRCRRYRR